MHTGPGDNIINAGVLHRGQNYIRKPIIGTLKIEVYCTWSHIIISQRVLNWRFCVTEELGVGLGTRLWNMYNYILKLLIGSQRHVHVV